MKSRLIKKRSWQQYLYSLPVIMVLFVVAGFLAVSVYERYTVAAEMGRRAAHVAEQLEELKARQAQLQEKVEYLQDESGREAEIRKHFDVARPDEQVVIIVDDEDATPADSQVAAPATAVPESEPWYKFW